MARLVAVLALSASAAVVVLLGGPHWMSLLVVGTFMLASPGLVLVEMLRVRDGLLGLVLSMMVGPVLWVVLSTGQVFAGLWNPRITVLAVAGLLALAASMLLLALRGVSVPETSRHRFRSHQHDKVVVDASGRHRGAFPAPGARVQSRIRRRLG
ncbi:MAG: hypothetical protein ABI873_13955 [Marmoricola sp.]